MNPTGHEKKLIAKCLLEAGILIGSPTEIWSHQMAWRALETWRLCVDAITLLIGGRHGVQPSFIKACVMQTEGLKEGPFCLDDIAEFLAADPQARMYWDALTSDDRFPQRCPHCKAAAYVGFNEVDCKARCQSGH